MTEDPRKKVMEQVKRVIKELTDNQRQLDVEEREALEKARQENFSYEPFSVVPPPIPPTGKLSLPEVVDHFIPYYEKNPHTWGSLHVVLSDGNIDDSSVELCIRSAKEAGDEEGERLARILLRLSKTQRAKLPYAVSGATARKQPC